MTKIWAKIMVNHRVKKSLVHNCGAQVTEETFYDNVREICESLKISTPVVIKTYAENFLEFNTFKFKQRDFLEEIPFDFLVLENGD